jgi:hypothetical protein
MQKKGGKQHCDLFAASRFCAVAVLWTLVPAVAAHRQQRLAALAQCE